MNVSCSGVLAWRDGEVDKARFLGLDLTFCGIWAECGHWGFEQAAKARPASVALRTWLARKERLRFTRVGDEARPHPEPRYEHESKREPPHPDPLIHKCMEEREMERRARVPGIHGRNCSANSLPQEREQIDDAPGESDQIQPNQTCGGMGPGARGQWKVDSG
jgi:hypothetical protein